MVENEIDTKFCDDLERNDCKNSQKSSRPTSKHKDWDIGISRLSAESLTPEAKHAQRYQKVGSSLSLPNIKITEIDSDANNSSGNPTGGAKHAVGLHSQDLVSTASPIETIISFLRHGNPDEALCYHCQTYGLEDIVIERKVLENEGSVKCKLCGETMQVDPWWVINECTELKSVEGVDHVKEEIVRFIKYHNRNNRFSCNKDFNRINAICRFEPLEKDRFGIVSSVRCKNCEKQVSLEMNTANNHTLTMVEKSEDLSPGDEIIFRRWYGISHHAIYLGKDERDMKNNGCCNGCMKFFRISDEKIDVISHTFHENDARIIKSSEWLQGGIDVYRVEYDNYYPPKLTEMIAKRAEQHATVSQQSSDSSYDPLMENCEHFARRCKTGQSESRQVQACIYNCCINIAMLALRVAILATWWISEAVIKDNEQTENQTLKGLSLQRMQTYVITREDLTEMEVTLSTSLCILFSTVKVVLSSILECRHIRRRRGSSEGKQNNYTEAEKHRSGCEGNDADKKTAIGYRPGYSRSCSKCCCKCCICPALRYLCRMLCCLVPFRLCKEFCSTRYWTGCSCEIKCKQCCHDPILKFCCRQYVVIVLRVIVSEVIVIGIPIALFATFELYCTYPAFTSNSPIRAAIGFAFTFPLVLVLSLVHSCIRNILSRTIGWCCLRCCCCCYCCCSLKDSGLPTSVKMSNIPSSDC